jgi:hypothetical protein
MKFSCATIVGLGVMVFGSVFSGGCVSSWPPIEDRQIGKDHVNYAPAPELAGHALAWATLRYPPVAKPVRGEVYETPLALSLPDGTWDETYWRVVERVKGTRPGQIQPAMPSNRDWYTYFITRVIVRNVSAEVDVVRPNPDIGLDETGRPRYQKVTIYFSGGHRPWVITSVKAFPLGMGDMPERNELPDESVAPVRR